MFGKEDKSLAVNAILNGIKQACSIFFPFISFVYSSRILGADLIGEYSFGQSIVAYFLLVSVLGIPSYALREGAALKADPKKLNKFIDQVYSINCFMTIVSYTILFVCLVFVKTLRIYRIIILIQSIQIILTTLGTDWINSIFEDYAYITIRYIIIQIVSILGLILFVKGPKDIYLYTLITMLSNAGGNVFNWFYLRKKYYIYPSLVMKIDWDKHLLPILVLFFNSIAAIIYMNSDITMIGFLVNVKSVGIYTISSKIYSMVKTLINAIIMVTVPRFSYYIANKRNLEYKESLSQVFNILLMIIYPCLVGMFMESKKILLLVAGKEYLAGECVIKILSIALIPAVCGCFFSYSILIPNKLEKKFLYATVIAAIANIILNCVCIPLYNINGAAITTLLAEIIVCMTTAFFSIKTVKFKLGIKNVFSVLISGIGVICICLIIDNFFSNYIVALFLDILLSSIVYIIMLILTKNKIAIDLFSKINVQ